MKTLRVLIGKELSDYFSAWYVYIIAALFVIAVNTVFVQDFFLYREATIKYLFDSGNTLVSIVSLPFLLIILIPALTMRSWAEEKARGTIELLMTLPVSMFQLVMSKLAANFIVVAFLLLLTINAPIMALYFGAADYGSIITSYLGLLMMSVMLILLGQLISLYSSNQVTSLVITLFCSIALYLAGVSQLTNGLPPVLRDIVQFVSIPIHLESFRKGILDSRDWLYFISIDVVLVLLILKSYLAVKFEGK